MYEAALAGVKDEIIETIPFFRVYNDLQGFMEEAFC